MYETEMSLSSCSYSQVFINLPTKMGRKNKLLLPIKWLSLIFSLLSSCSCSSKGLKSFVATIGSGSEDGTDDDVYLQLSGGRNGSMCTTGAIYYGGLYDSWSPGDKEQYLSENQDFGSCNNFEANKANVSFTMIKGETDGLTLTKMEFNIGGDIYVWEGQAGWDPSHPVEMAICTMGNCLPGMAGFFSIGTFHNFTDQDFRERESQMA